MKAKILPVIAVFAAAAFVSACDPSGSAEQTTPSASASASDTSTPDSDTSGTSGSTTSGSADSSSTGSGSTSSTSGSGATTAPSAGGTTTHHLRALTATERKTYEHCHQDSHAHGCDNYTDKALRARGIDPAR